MNYSFVNWTINALGAHIFSKLSILTLEGDDERITPSQYISSMMLNTEERLIATRHMKLPTIIELLDMSQVKPTKIRYQIMVSLGLHFRVSVWPTFD